MTTQIVRENGVYDIIVNTDNEIKAVVTAQIRQNDELGGYILSAQMGTITQNNKGLNINGNIPTDILPNIITEFNDIVNELKNN